MDPCSNRSPRRLLVTRTLYIVLIRAPSRSGTSSRMRRGWGDNLIGYGGDASLGRFYGGAGNDTVQSRDVPAVKDTVTADRAPTPSPPTRPTSSPTFARG